MPKSNEKIKCRICKKQKSAKSFYDRKNGLSDTCKDCEEQRFKELERQSGSHIALFGMCLGTDTPFYPLILPTVPDLAKEENKWAFYNSELVGTKNDKGKDGELRGFSDGCTNILKVFGRNLTEKDTAEYLRNELEKQKALQGTEEQRETWGTADHYTSEEYDLLDRMYENRAVNFKGQTITEQMEYTLREVAKWQLLADKLRREGDIKNATDALKTCDTLLGSECLRKKDEKPSEKFRPDAWIENWRSKGYMVGDNFVSKEKMFDAICKELTRRKYNQTVDAVHQLELNIVNNARKNADLPTMFFLPEDMKIISSEFAEEESDQEKNAKTECGLTTVKFVNTVEDNADR